MIKSIIYDQFQCMADACPLTCCRGWAIRADGGIYEKWKSHEETSYLCEQVIYKKEDGESIYHMKTDSGKTCVMLDEKGLCEIVKRHGDEYLSDTCASFPRKHNQITILCEDKDVDEPQEKIVMDEYSMSGACPAVLKLIRNSKDVYIVDIPEKCRENHDFPMEYQVRNAVIKIMQNREFSLSERFMLSFSLLHECLACEWEDDIYDCIAVYQDMENLLDVVSVWQNMRYDAEEAFVEICETWLDVTVFYKEEDMYRPYLFELAGFVEIADADKGMIDKLVSDWKTFKEDWKKYDMYWENVLVSEIFADCISEDLEYLMEAFQSIMMEYVMTRITVFMQQEMVKKQVSEEELHNYTSLFIRMIGHNTDGMAEYWEENFEDSILEKEYFYLLLQ